MTRIKHRRARRFRTEDAMLKSLMNVALHYGRDKGPRMIAREENTTVERVYGWAAALRGRGVKIPSLPRSGIYQRVIAELAQKNADLLDKRVKVLPN